ncbi:AAEL013303-PA [Aedes aegypti]|uniref:AAEL013303-PA n=1 Tax=Aedes aegypti TaxID=7159 RepID=Q16JK5_AEDAE|nr:AAEL013303-PA [Aedes aegypti]
MNYRLLVWLCLLVPLVASLPQEEGLRSLLLRRGGRVGTKGQLQLLGNERILNSWERLQCCNVHKRTNFNHQLHHHYYHDHHSRRNRHINANHVPHNSRLSHHKPIVDSPSGLQKKQGTAGLTDAQKLLLDTEIGKVAERHDQQLRQLAFGSFTSFSDYFLDNLKKSNVAVGFAFAQSSTTTSSDSVGTTSEIPFYDEVDDDAKSAANATTVGSGGTTNHHSKSAQPASLTLDQSTNRFPGKVWGEGTESKFGPILEYVLQRIQTLFSVYKHDDLSRPGVPIADAVEAKSEDAKTTEATTTTTSSTVAPVQKKGLHPLLARKKFAYSPKEAKAKATEDSGTPTTTLKTTTTTAESSESSSVSSLATRRTRPTRPAPVARASAPKAGLPSRVPRTTTKRTTTTPEPETSSVTTRTTRRRGGRPTRPSGSQFLAGKTATEEKAVPVAPTVASTPEEASPSSTAATSSLPSSPASTAAAPPAVLSNTIPLTAEATVASEVVVKHVPLLPVEPAPVVEAQLDDVGPDQQLA